MEKLLNSEELALILGKTRKQITPQKLVQWQLPVVRLDHRRLFRQSDVEKLIERSLVRPPAMPSEEGENHAD